MIFIRVRYRRGEVRYHINGSRERLNKIKEVNHENNRRIGSKHSIGEYFVLFYGDGRPYHAR